MKSKWVSILLKIIIMPFIALIVFIMGIYELFAEDISSLVAEKRNWLVIAFFLVVDVVIIPIESLILGIYVAIGTDTKYLKDVANSIFRRHGK